jgi:hypothetical protein
MMSRTTSSSRHSPGGRPNQPSLARIRPRRLPTKPEFDLAELNRDNMARMDMPTPRAGMRAHLSLFIEKNQAEGDHDSPR